MHTIAPINHGSYSRHNSYATTQFIPYRVGSWVNLSMLNVFTCINDVNSHVYHKSPPLYSSAAAMSFCKSVIDKTRRRSEVATAHCRHFGPIRSLSELAGFQLRRDNCYGRLRARSGRLMTHWDTKLEGVEYKICLLYTSDAADE